MYELTSYARSRLKGSVISIDKHPCLVLDVEDDRQLFYIPVLGESVKQMNMDSDRIDLTPIQVGYVNFKQGATYLYRVARRRWKQGIDHQSVKKLGRDNRDNVDWLQSSAFLAAYYNDYPSFEEAYVEAKERRTTVAFSKKWAVDYQGYMFYRGKMVGNTLKLDEAYGYLKQMMERVL